MESEAGFPRDVKGENRGNVCVRARGKEVESAVPGHEKDRSVGWANNEGGLAAPRVISRRSSSLFGGSERGGV
jgi:hypothetical protein